MLGALRCNREGVTGREAEDTIGALKTSNAILGVPYYTYGILYPKTLFYLLRPLYCHHRQAGARFARYDQRGSAKSFSEQLVEGWACEHREIKVDQQ